jgi:hypothetical protein
LKVDKHDNTHTHTHTHTHTPRQTNKLGKERLVLSIMVSQNAVIAAFSSTALISLAPNVLLLLFPNFASGDGQNHSPILSLGQCLAAGGLLGDVFLHVVPHNAGGGHDVGLYILLGFTIFLIVDMIMRSISGSSHSHNHQHGHQHNEKKKNNDDDNDNGNDDDDSKSSSATIFLNLTADALHNVSKTNNKKMKPNETNGKK